MTYKYDGGIGKDRGLVCAMNVVLLIASNVGLTYIVRHFKNKSDLKYLK